MEELITEYWPILVAVAPVLFKLLNKYTPKWYKTSGYVRRIVLLLIDFLDLYTVEKDPGKEVKDA